MLGGDLLSTLQRQERSWAAKYPQLAQPCTQPTHDQHQQARQLRYLAIGTPNGWDALSGQGKFRLASQGEFPSGEFVCV